MRDILQIKQVGSSSEENYVSFRISRQMPVVSEIVTGLTSYGDWLFEICDCPEVSAEDGIFYLRGDEPDMDHSLIYCPGDLWESLKRSVRLFNLQAVTYKTLEEEFFERAL